MSKALSQTLTDIDISIKNGDISSAKKRFLLVSCKHVPRQNLTTYCQIAARLRMPSLTLKALNPFVRTTRSANEQATPDEKIEYALSLVNVGAAQEAIDILQTVDSNKFPKALLSQAFAYFSRWNYRASLPLLSQYVEHPRLNEYDHLIGNINLVGALVHEKRKMANILISELLGQTINRYPNLYGHVLLNAAENAINEKAWKEAQEYLNKAKAVFVDQQSVQSLFVHKWEMVIKASTDPKSRKSCFLSLRKAAKEIGHWETLRDCDRGEAMLSKNKELFLKVYFGTPWKHYRNWLEQDFGLQISIPQSYLREVPGTSGKSAMIIDLLSTEKPSSDLPLKHRKLASRLFRILNSDFYQSTRLGTIHALLYPDDYFNPFSSPNRVHQVVLRLKYWMSANKIPLLITHDSNGYKLTATKTCRILVTQNSTQKGRAAGGVLDELRGCFSNGKVFSNDDAATKLGMSTRSMRRFLQSSVVDGSIQRTGNGNKTGYKFGK